MTYSAIKEDDSTVNKRMQSLNIPETNKSSKEIEEILITARIDMLMTAPFFGNLATRLVLVDATEWCPTAATDGKYFYYNRHFTDALYPEEVVWLFGHEILHCVYDHMDPNRRGDRNPMLWNIANDYVNNLDLEYARIGERIRKQIIEVCFDTKYKDMTSEEVYDKIYEKMKENGQIVEVNFDMHLDREDGDDEGSGQEGDNDGTKGPVKFSAEEKENIKQEFQNAVMQSAKAAGEAGNLPSGVKRMLDKLLNPQLDWRQLLAMQIQSVIRSDYNFNVVSRKGLDSGIWLPGMDRETTIDVAIFIDLSGSILDEMARDFLSEVKGIMDQYNDYRIHIACFDTSVHNPQVFTPHNMEEFEDYDLVGGGGTDFNCCFDWMKEEGIQPKKMIMFTDGYPFGSWGDETYCDSLFIVHDGGYSRSQTPEAPFGITVKYTRTEQKEAA